MHALTSLPPSVLTRILDHLSASLPAGRRTEVLLLACLIAPALVEPSRRLLSREVSFSHRDGRRRLAKLRDTGALPVEWRPRRLAFSVIDAGEARELLGRAEEVEELRLEYVQGEVSSALFGLPSLRSELIRKPRCRRWRGSDYEG